MDINAVINDADVLNAIGYAPLAEQEALMGTIMKIPNPAQRQAAMSKVLRPQNINESTMTSRGQAMSRLGALPKEIQQGLVQKKLQLVDTRFYFVKAANAVTSVRMIETSDTKAVGVTNVDRGKLDKDNYFLLTGLILLSGVNASPLAASFGTVATTIANGDFEFKCSGNKYLLPKDSSCQVFDTNNRTDIENGLFKLDNPKWIEPQAEINFDIRFPVATAANTNIKLVMVGVSVINY